MIHTGAMCDPYLPLEAQCRLTRRCSEIIARRGFGLSIQTKSDGILEDLDLLQRIARQSKCVAQMTLTTCDEKLCKILEPGVCGTRRRARALKQMTRRGHRNRGVDFAHSALFERHGGKPPGPAGTLLRCGR